MRAFPYGRRHSIFSPSTEWKKFSSSDRDKNQETKQGGRSRRGAVLRSFQEGGKSYISDTPKRATFFQNSIALKLTYTKWKFFSKFFHFRKGLRGKQGCSPLGLGFRLSNSENCVSLNWTYTKWKKFSKIFHFRPGS